MKYYNINCPECHGKLDENVSDAKFSCANKECGYDASYDHIKESFENGTIAVLESEVNDGAVSPQFTKTLLEGDYENDDDDDKEMDKPSNKMPDKNKKSKKGMKEPKDMDRERDEESSTVTEEAIKRLFEGQELDKDFRDKLATVFRAAVHETVDIEKEKLQEAFTDQVAEVQAEFDAKLTEEKDQLSESLEKTLDYVVEQYLEQNKVEIETNLKVEAAENLLNGMKSLFEDNHLEVPEGKNIEEEYEAQLADVKAKLNESLSNSIDLKAKLKERDKADAVKSVSEGLTDVEVSKLTKLSESVKFDNSEQYTAELKTLRESFLGKQSVNEEVVVPDITPTEKINESASESVDKPKAKKSKPSFRFL